MVAQSREAAKCFDVKLFIFFFPQGSKLKIKALALILCKFQNFMGKLKRTQLLCVIIITSICKKYSFIFQDLELCFFTSVNLFLS